MKNMIYSSGLLIAAAMLATACQPAPASTPAPTEISVVPTEAVAATVPAVLVSDQSVDGGQVVVAQVDSNGPGWIVIHAQKDGKPGPVLGYSAVNDGETQNVQVTIDDSGATPVMYAMLHVDAGMVGTYEFPGDDKPATLDGQMVSPAFNVSGLDANMSSGDMSTSKGGTGYGDSGYDDNSSASAAMGDSVTLMVSSKEGLGSFLVDGNGMTLYLFTKDTPGVSNCSGGCLEAWPPLLVSGDPVAGEGVTGQLGTIKSADGSLQVTYNDMPLYYYVSDVQPGDTTGQEIGGVWFVVEP